MVSSRSATEVLRIRVAMLPYFKADAPVLTSLPSSPHSLKLLDPHPSPSIAGRILVRLLETSLLFGVIPTSSRYLCPVTLPAFSTCPQRLHLIISPCPAPGSTGSRGEFRDPPPQHPARQCPDLLLRPRPAEAKSVRRYFDDASDARSTRSSAPPWSWSVRRSDLPESRPLRTLVL